ncbi:MAG: heme o synthase [Halobacteriales archaeon]
MTPALAVTVVAVYGLILTGATASLVDAGGACSTWPACTGADPFASTTVLVAMGHRVATLLVGLAVLALTVAVWAESVPGGVRWSVTLAAGLFPVQVAMGAVTAVTGGSDALGLAHLTVAMAIFAAVLAALVRWLEWETRDVDASYDSPTVGSDPAPASPDSRGTLRAYLELTKPRLMWLLCAVALAGVGLAVGSTAADVSAWTVLGTLLGGVLAIGASGTFNHVLERDVDRRMARTADRPVATDLVGTRRALAFGVALAAASLGVFLWLVNPLSAALGLVAIAFYSVVYTVVLKPHTTQNIVLGGAVGAFPALIGWAAVTGSIGLPALVLGAIIFLWTPAHFYNLALAYRRDYARGGFPMLPVVRGAWTTQRHIAAYLGATLVAVAVLGAVSSLGWLYVATGVIFAAAFLWAVVDLYRHRTHAAAMRAFVASNAFLGALMLVIVVETLLL